MKNGLKKLLLPLIAILSISMTACGAEDKAKIIEQSIQANENIKSFHSVIDMDLSMTVAGQSQDQKITTTMDIFSDPIKAKMTMDVAGQALTMYLDDSYTYTGMGDMWFKTKMDSASLTQQTDTTLYLKNIENFTLDGEEKVNGIDTYKITGIITGDSIEEVLNSNPAFGSLTENNGMEDITTLFKKAGDIPITLWISKTDYINVQTDMDMTAFMQTIMNNLIASAGSLDEGTTDEDYLKINKYTMRMTISDVNSIADFEIPAEALNATELEDNGSIMSEGSATSSSVNAAATESNTSRE